MEDVISRASREALGETARRCTATNRSGTRCRRASIVGGFVCPNHGGKIPAVQRTARERLLAMVDPALDALLRFLRTAPPCPHCGRSDADRDPVVLRAAQLVLDRTGFHPGVDVHLQPAPAPAFAAYLPWMPADRLTLIRTWLAEAKDAMDRGQRVAEIPVPPRLEGAVEAVLVDGVGD